MQHDNRFCDVPVAPEVPVDSATLSSYRASRFPANAGPTPWLDRDDAGESIERLLGVGEIDSTEAELCRKWAKDGYVILPGFFDHAELDETWAAYEAAIAAGRLTPPIEPLFEGDTLPGRVANPHFAVELVDRMLHDPRMVRVVSLLLGAKAVPFQTIIGYKSSEQLQHSDSIHMSTYPTGYLAANWIAFEDIHPDSGPLVYHPGSHRLPYLLSEDLGIPADPEYRAYREIYEPAIQRVIADHALAPAYFLSKKGDVLLWHANLLHGGSKLRGTAYPSRKALVCHYFAEGCICYHDLTGTPAHTQVNQTHMLYTHEGVPGSFDPEKYLAANPDVAAAGVDPRRHYLEFGRGEGRRLRP